MATALPAASAAFVGTAAPSAFAGTAAPPGIVGADDRVAQPRAMA
jgi:hypothetical protein